MNGIPKTLFALLYALVLQGCVAMQAGEDVTFKAGSEDALVLFGVNFDFRPPYEDEVRRLATINLAVVDPTTGDTDWGSNIQIRRQCAKDWMSDYGCSLEEPFHYLSVVEPGHYAISSVSVFGFPTTSYVTLSKRLRGDVAFVFEIKPGQVNYMGDLEMISGLFPVKRARGGKEEIGFATYLSMVTHNTDAAEAYVSRFRGVSAPLTVVPVRRWKDLR